ncbi:MAG TPA: hypothetical protein VM140_02620 [Burkholderiales bacterium]|nr:hypothetical protein [Burkholderiales bacterium]
MRSLRCLLASIALVLLAACVTPAPPLFAPAADQTTPPPPADRAQIVFISPGNTFSMASHVFEVRGEEKEFIGTVGSKTKMVVNVTPGQHLFMSNSVGFGHFLDANVDAGKRYYILLRYVHGRGLQLRPLRNIGGDPEFTVGNPKFTGWLADTQLIVKSSEADGFYTQHKSFHDDAQKRGWTEWQEKRPDQRAELTLNREDSVDR